jgi:glycosyltransferase involved in cell wall biosynthesis
MEIITMQIKNLPNTAGGSYIKYMELIEEFLNRGWKVHHISPEGFTSIQHDLLVHHGVRDTSITPSFLPFSIQAFMRFLSIQRNSNIDAVVTFSFLEGLLGVLFKIFGSKIKVIVAVHGDHIAGYFIDSNYVIKLVYSQVLRLVEKIVLSCSDLIIFVSEYNRNTIMKRAGFTQTDKTQLLYNNISRRIIALSKEPSVRLSQDKKILGYVGSLHARGKGLVYLISAFHIIKREIPDSMLVIVGDGPDKGELISLVKELDLCNDVIFTGFKSNPIAYMKGFDILILPSLHEACSLVLLEALCMDIPVLGSSVGGTPEILKYEELLFNAADAEIIASKVVNLFQNPNAYLEAVNLCRTRKNSFLFDWGEEMARIVQEIVE